jgi:hypothetical protein
MQVIDADGHINDHAGAEEIAACMPKGNRMAKLFPDFDHLHFRYLKQNRRPTGNPSADDWNRFFDDTRIDWTVLYPTAGLAVGRIMAPDWAEDGAALETSTEKPQPKVGMSRAKLAESAKLRDGVSSMPGLGGLCAGILLFPWARSPEDWREPQIRSPLAKDPGARAGVKPLL